MPKNILLIEKEEVMGGLISDKLDKAGYVVFRAKNREEGIRAIYESNPDLIILDMDLPPLGGLELLEQIRHDPRVRTMPVLVILDSVQLPELDLLKECGVKDWLVKTEFDSQEMLEKVEKQIEA